MSIDARISAITVISPDKCDVCEGSGKDPDTKWDDCPSCHGATKDNPKVRLKLEPRQYGGVAGQSVLTLLNPPTVDPQVLAGLIGTEIWGGSGEIMVGNKLWARRVGYTSIELVSQQADNKS